MDVIFINGVVEVSQHVFCSPVLPSKILIGRFLFSMVVYMRIVALLCVQSLQNKRKDSVLSILLAFKNFFFNASLMNTI